MEQFAKSSLQAIQRQRPSLLRCHSKDKELSDAQLEDATGGEIFSILLDKLIQIKKRRPEVYAVIREETDWMIAFARKIDYL